MPWQWIPPSDLFFSYSLCSAKGKFAFCRGIVVVWGEREGEREGKMHGISVDERAVYAYDARKEGRTKDRHRSSTL